MSAGPGSRRLVLVHALSAITLACPLQGLGQTGSRSAAAAAPGQGSAAQGPVYNVELVVFRASGGPAQSEDWTAAVAGAVRNVDGGEAAVGAAIVGRFVGVLPPAQHQLKDLQARLAASGAYEPLAHVAWSQTASSWGSRAGFTLARLGVEAPGLSGLAYLERGSFLHLGLSLRYAPSQSGAAYALHELRRVRFFERNYYDHPAFGAIALVTPAQGARPAGR